MSTQHLSVYTKDNKIKLLRDNFTSFETPFVMTLNFHFFRMFYIFIGYKVIY